MDRRWKAQTHGLRRVAVEKGVEVGGVQGGLQLRKPGSSPRTWLRVARRTYTRYAALPTQDADLVATAASEAWRGAAGIAPCPASVQRSRAEPARVSYARTQARTHALRLTSRRGSTIAGSGGTEGSGLPLVFRVGAATWSFGAGPDTHATAFDDRRGSMILIFVQQSSCRLANQGRARRREQVTCATTWAGCRRGSWTSPKPTTGHRRCASPNMVRNCALRQQTRHAAALSVMRVRMPP
jgi:hypothetical protein